MQLEQGLWAYCPKNKIFAELYYIEGIGFYFCGFIDKYYPQPIDWPNLEIFTMREVK